MIKYKILGAINLLLGLLSTYLFVFSLNVLPYVKRPSEFYFVGLPLLSLISALINCFIAYRLFTNKEENKKLFFIHIILLINTIAWFAIFYFGLFLASEPVVPLFSFTFAAVTFLTMINKNKKIAVSLCAITIVVTIYSISLNFEEDYCWRRGYQADSSGSKMVTATVKDAEALKSFDVATGSQIGLSFKTHMLCHITFNAFSALKENFISKIIPKIGV